MEQLIDGARTGVVQPGVLQKLGPVGWLEIGKRQQQRIRELQRKLKRDRGVVLMSVSWFIQRGLAPLEAAEAAYRPFAAAEYHDLLGEILQEPANENRVPLEADRRAARGTT